MYANHNTSSDDLVTNMVVRAISEVAAEVGEEEISTEQLRARAQMRYSELSMPYRQGVDVYAADTISATLIEVAERAVISDGAETFSIDTVVDESMAALERTLGAPEDRDNARAAVRAYLDEAHGLPR